MYSCIFDHWNILWWTYFWAIFEVFLSSSFLLETFENWPFSFTTPGIPLLWLPLVLPVSPSTLLMCKKKKNVRTELMHTDVTSCIQRTTRGSQPLLLPHRARTTATRAGVCLVLIGPLVDLILPHKLLKKKTVAPIGETFWSNLKKLPDAAWPATREACGLSLRSKSDNKKVAPIGATFWPSLKNWRQMAPLCTFFSFYWRDRH